MVNIKSKMLFFALLLSIITLNARANWSIDVESGIAFNGYNDVRIPGNTGTDISLTDDLEADPAAFVRLRLSKEFNKKHILSLLAAPLSIKASGRVDRDIDFNGVRFVSQEPLNSTYRFDSYRLTYRYTLVNKTSFRAGIGVTAKIRDASIKIESPNNVSEKKNTGFVPLINFALDWRFAQNIGLMLKGDALAAPQGRAEDVILALYGYPMNDLRFRLGYRILEGGADNDEVYNFALVHYLSAGLTWSF